ncbi:AAA family ATPase [Leptospira interrogans]|uniref:AAA family ATPase n=1 Tax=Leptospira interrogans TaxID=173 RepID=UPI0007747145|nr:AAA family ATPase [Leptospira interrogans]
MATSEQLRALIKSHFNGESERFKTVALQLAASEAKKGHQRLADEIKSLVDSAKQSGLKIARRTDSIHQPKGELSNLLSVKEPNIRLSNLIINKEQDKRIDRILQEQRNLKKIRTHGLRLRRKLLLAGPPGTGKTMTAAAIAGELGLPFFTVKLDGLITRYLGETAVKLRLIFDAIQDFRGVYFFDEFDSIGSKRYDNNDVGEMRRVLNSFLQYIESDESSSLILAATNHFHMLDIALFRRFDDIIQYALPDKKQISALFKNSLSSFKFSDFQNQKLIGEAQGLSHSEIVRSCEEAAKSMLLKGKKEILKSDIITSLQERKSIKVTDGDGSK